MIIAMVAVPRSVGSHDIFPLCQLTAVDFGAGLQELKEMLVKEGIDAEQFAHQMLKWQDTYFYVVDVGPLTSLRRVLSAVREAQRRKDDSVRIGHILGNNK